MDGDKVDMIMDTAGVLRNELIISNVFRYLSPPTLGACRLVCLLWNNEVLLHTRKRVTLNFSAYRTKHIAKFVETMGPSVAAGPASFPYTRFVITIWDHGVNRDSKEFCGCGPDYIGCRPEIPYATQTFFLTFGPCIKHLELSINEFEQCLEDRHRGWLATNLPNLLELVLVGQSSIGLENKNPAPINVTPSEIFGLQFKSLALVDKFGERDHELRAEPQPPQHLPPSPSRFNQQFVANVFKMCQNVTELTVDTLDCKTPCSLTESVLQALVHTSEVETGINTRVTPVSTLVNLNRLNLQTTVHVDDLFRTVTKICGRYKLDELHVKCVEMRSGPVAGLVSGQSGSQMSASAFGAMLEDCVKTKCEGLKVVTIKEIISAHREHG